MEYVPQTGGGYAYGSRIRAKLDEKLQVLQAFTTLEIPGSGQDQAKSLLGGWSPRIQG